MKKIYEGITIHRCIDEACRDLGINKEELKYKVVDQKKSFFRKKSIEVEIDDHVINNKSETSKSTIGDEAKVPSNSNNGSAKVVNGKLIVSDPKDGGKPACIVVSNNIKVTIDGTEVSKKVEVYEKNDIKVEFKEDEAYRELNIKTSKDNMKVYANLIYKPKITYKLKDKDYANNLVLEREVESKIDPPKYTIAEVKQELSKKNINCGIIEENLEKLIQGTQEDCLLAQGTPKVDPVDDFVEIKFKIDENMKKLKEDKLGNIDFKSIGSVEAVKKGDIIAVKHDGKDGTNGKDVTGKLITSRPKKKLNLTVGNGCLVKDNTVVAAIDGKPCTKGKTFCVYQLHEVRSDVDLKTGNIKFIGDINIYGSVMEGMLVECGNSLTVEKDVDRAQIKAKGNVNIKGNVIGAKIFAGGEDVNRIKCINDITTLKELLKSLILAVEEIKRYDLLGKGKKDGQVIKILIENKFKTIPRICLSIITNFKLHESELEGQDLIEMLHGKLLGISPINIKNYNELNSILDCIEEKSVILKNSLSIPVNINISYCQDSNISSSGDVTIVGKGEYISNIDANGKIDFVQERSVARGGILKAKEEIKCRVVGSTAGVTTKLQVEKNGNIWADEAYQNTAFVVGTKEYILDIPSKNIHVYLNSEGDIQVDKFVL